MKKKLITLLLAATFVLSLAACGGKETTTPADTDSTSDSDETPAADTGNNESQEETEKKENASGVDLPVVYKIPGEDIYVDAPAFQEIEEAFTEVFIVHGEKYVAVTGARLSTATDAEAAHLEAFEDFTINMSNYEGGVNSINISESETKTVNGMEVYRFEGTINYGWDDEYNSTRDTYAVGYSFIMDDIPCQIIGSVISEGQEEETKQEIEEIVDAMIETVRSEQ